MSLIYALLAFLPIIATVILMTVFSVPAKKALMLAWFMALLIGIFVWKMPIADVAAQTVSGFLGSLDATLVIFGAVLVMNTLKNSGGMSVIDRGFRSVSRDSRIQAIIIGFMFGSFIEGAAGYGTPAALAGPLLVSLGFPSVAAATVALIFDSAAVSFGAVGTPVITSMSQLSDTLSASGIDYNAYQGELSLWSALPHTVFSVFLPFIVICIMTKFYGKQKSFKAAFEVFGFAVFAGLCFSVPYVLIAAFLGAEFPSMFSGVIGLALTVFAAKKGFLVPKKVWTFGENTEQAQTLSKINTEQNPSADATEMPLWRAWLPYVIIGIILVATRIEAFGLKKIFSGFSLDTGNIFGVSGASYSFKPLWIPGIVPFVLAALITVPLHKMKKREATDAWKTSFRQVSPAAVAIAFGVALVQIMKNSATDAMSQKSMMTVIADFLADIAGKAYLFIAPFIGVLGAFISGSNTVSNILFTNLQYGIASNLGLSTVIVVALQTVGGAIGNIICINNVVAACATVGAVGKEGKIIKTNFIPMLIYTLAAFLTVVFLINLGFSPSR